MRKWVMAVMAAVALLTACGRNAEPQAVAEPTRWDPCSITPEQIAATGLDPDYREVGWGRGIEVKDWARCTFSPVGFDVDYLLSVKSSLNHTIDEARSDPSNLAGRTTVLNGRDAFQYKTDVARSIDDCNVAVELPPGVVVFTLNYMKVDHGVDPCSLLDTQLMTLKNSLPA